MLSASKHRGPTNKNHHLTLHHLQQWTCSQDVTPGEEGRDGQAGESYTHGDRGHMNSGMKRRRGWEKTGQYSRMQCSNWVGKSKRKEEIDTLILLQLTGQNNTNVRR